MLDPLVSGAYVGREVSVDLDNKMCSSKKWQLYGIPCAHAISVVACQGEEVEIYIDEYYHISASIKMYERVVKPINGSNLWPTTAREKPLPAKKD